VRCEMNNCKLTEVLNRLRKSSSDSIDNVENFTEFKRYMHVTRKAEDDLRQILRNINNSGKKTLVLLCGSAGDGKSHLLSYLKNADDEKLLREYTVYNDATESSAPSKTAIETLNEFLAGFRDENLEHPGKNIILAINLGVLSNFIESEFGAQYMVLKDYVEAHNILTSKIVKKDYEWNSNFQHVSFSDYHMYSLCETGVRAEYIQKIMEKIFSIGSGNDFYDAYKGCESCPLMSRCPVCKNYEYMMDAGRQRYVAELLVKTTIKDKAILTTREILNFIYDIVVSKDFSYTKYQKLLVDDAAYVKEFLRHITPTMLFESSDLTPLMNMVRNYDPLLVRNEEADQIAISYYVSSDVVEDVKKVINQTVYEDILCSSILLERINGDRTIKSQVFNLMMRINALENNGIKDIVYDEYLTNLYLYNAGKGKKLGPLYSMVRRSLVQWCGSDSEGNICIDDGRRGFALYEDIEFKESLDLMPETDGAEELQRFVPYLVVTYKTNDGQYISLDIDYSMYELLYKLMLGYVQTADDRNNHADFISFVDRILQMGNLENEVSVISNNGKRAVVSKNTFGYTFKVVK